MNVNVKRYIFRNPPLGTFLSQRLKTFDALFRHIARKEEMSAYVCCLSPETIENYAREMS